MKTIPLPQTHIIGKYPETIMVITKDGVVKEDGA